MKIILSLTIFKVESFYPDILKAHVIGDKNTQKKREERAERTDLWLHLAGIFGCRLRQCTVTVCIIAHRQLIVNVCMSQINLSPVDIQIDLW